MRLSIPRPTRHALGAGLKSLALCHRFQTQQQISPCRREIAAGISPGVGFIELLVAVGGLRLEKSDPARGDHALIERTMNAVNNALGYLTLTLPLACGSLSNLPFACATSSSLPSPHRHPRHPDDSPYSVRKLPRISIGPRDGNGLDPRT